MKVGQVINLKEGSKCTTYPFNEFNYYMGEKRNNNITKGIVIEAKEFMYKSGMHSLLVKDFKSDTVCVYRTYNNEFEY